MFRGLPTASLPIVKLFDSPYLFSVPAYQRPYSWTTKEAGQLLEDLVIAAGLDDQETAAPDYFLGTILLMDPEADAISPPPPFSGPRIFEVVDGQQRLVTISILASVLRDKEDVEGPFSEDDPSVADRLHAMVAVEPDLRDLTARRCRIQLRDGQQGVLEAEVLARESRNANIPRLPDDKVSGINLVREHLAGEVEALSGAERRKLGRYLMDYCHVVVMISRDVDRAHRLFTVLNDRGRPLERNDIIKAEVLRSVPARSATAALDLWETAHASLGSEFETFLGHLRLIHGLQRLPIIAGVRCLVRELGSERFLAEQLSPMAAAFNRVRLFSQQQDSQSHPALAGALVSLNRLGRADWVPAAILAMDQFAASPGLATRLMSEIERFAYLLRLLCYGAGKRQRRFASAIDAIRNNPTEALASSAWDITREEQRTIGFHLKDLHRRNAAMSKLVLMRIEDELAGAPLTIDPAELTVEHVLPLRPAASSDWKRFFADAEQRADCQTCLGNLALVTPRQNDRAKNKDFADKLAIYREAGVGSLALVSNADILETATWVPKDILAREARLLGIIANIWRIDVGSPPPNGVGRGVRMFG